MRALVLTPSSKFVEIRVVLPKKHDPLIDNDTVTNKSNERSSMRLKSGLTVLALALASSAASSSPITSAVLIITTHSEQESLALRMATELGEKDGRIEAAATSVVHDTALKLKMSNRLNDTGTVKTKLQV